jgi:hypothetical protein
MEYDPFSWILDEIDDPAGMSDADFDAAIVARLEALDECMAGVYADMEALERLVGE